MNKEIRGMTHHLKTISTDRNSFSRNIFNITKINHRHTHGSIDLSLMKYFSLDLIHLFNKLPTIGNGLQEMTNTTINLQRNET